MSSPDPIVIDCHYTGREEVAAAFLLREGDRAAIIETNTTHAVPRLLEALQAEGMTPEQVEWIIITHVHLDHAGGAAALLEACSNATLLGHPKATPHVIDPEKLVQSAKAIYGEQQFEALYGTIEPAPAERVRAVEDGEVLRFGGRELRFFFTRGHANHHMCIWDSASNAVFAGDNFGIVYPGLQDGGRFAFPSSPPTDFDAEEALKSVARIVETGAERVYVTHFGGYADLERIAGQLREQLELFRGWVDEAYGSEMEDGALDGWFNAKVGELFQTRLSAHGVDEADPRRAVLGIDMMLNAQGLAFAVKKRRYKAKKAAAERASAVSS